jgi:hypothetical protein
MAFQHKVSQKVAPSNRRKTLTGERAFPKVFARFRFEQKRLSRGQQRVSRL